MSRNINTFFYTSICTCGILFWRCLNSQVKKSYTKVVYKNHYWCIPLFMKYQMCKNVKMLDWSTAEFFFFLPLAHFMNLYAFRPSMWRLTKKKNSPIIAHATFTIVHKGHRIIVINFSMSLSNEQIGRERIWARIILFETSSLLEYLKCYPDVWK